MSSSQSQSHFLPKIRAVEEWPTPTSRQQLQHFVGFAYFYQRFICDYSRVATFLIQLTATSAPFTWTPEAEYPEGLHRWLFINLPVLKHPDPGLQFVVQIESSDSSLNEMLPLKGSTPIPTSQDVSLQWKRATILVTRNCCRWFWPSIGGITGWMVPSNSRQAQWFLFLSRLNTPFSTALVPTMTNLMPSPNSTPLIRCPLIQNPSCPL